MDLKNMHEQIWKRYQSRVPLKYLNKKTDLELLFMNCNAEYGTLSSMKVRTEWSGWVGELPHYGTKDTTWYVADAAHWDSLPSSSLRTLWPRKEAWILVAALLSSGSVRSMSANSSSTCEHVSVLEWMSGTNTVGVHHTVSSDGWSVISTVLSFGWASEARDML